MELSGTTEQETDRGNVTYTTEDGREPHITDHLRAFAVASEKIDEIAAGGQSDVLSEFGWVKFRREGSFSVSGYQ